LEREVPVFDNVNRMQFGLGLMVVLVATALLLLDVVESGIAGGIGIIGIVLLAASGKRADRNLS
jgi:hypothetical protein